MPAAQVVVDVRTERAVALAGLSLPEALAELGAEVPLRYHERRILGGGGRGNIYFLLGRLPRSDAFPSTELVPSPPPTLGRLELIS